MPFARSIVHKGAEVKKTDAKSIPMLYVWGKLVGKDREI